MRKPLTLLLNRVSPFGLLPAKKIHSLNLGQRRRARLRDLFFTDLLGDLRTFVHGGNPSKKKSHVTMRVRNILMTFVDAESDVPPNEHHDFTVRRQRNHDLPWEMQHSIRSNTARYDTDKHSTQHTAPKETSTRHEMDTTERQ